VRAEPQITWPEPLSALVSEEVEKVAASGADSLARNIKTIEGARYFQARDKVAWATGTRLWQEKPDLLGVYVQEADTNSHAWTFTVYGKARRGVKKALKRLSV
jgi:hypothetical protein